MKIYRAAFVEDLKKELPGVNYRTLDELGDRNSDSSYYTVGNLEEAAAGYQEEIDKFQVELKGLQQQQSDLRKVAKYMQEKKIDILEGFPAPRG